MSEEKLEKRAVPVVPFSVGESPLSSVSRTVSELTDPEAQQRRLKRLFENKTGE